MAIDTTTSVDVKTLTPFKRFIMTLGILPTSYLESMTYAELLMWFCNFLQNEVIPTVNNNAQAVEEIQNWINTLDLQDEVNNKLDEMAESGQLQEIIADYLNSKAVFGFDTVADMKPATNLIAGSYAKTLGYYSKNDNGSALYKIRTITNDDIVDEGSIIALNDNTLIAELITTTFITPEMFGCKGDNSTIDTQKMQNAIDFAINKKLLLKSQHNKTYIIDDTIVFDGVFEADFGDAEIKGNFNDILVQIKVSDNQGYDENKEIYWSYGGYLKNLTITGNNQGTGLNVLSQKKMEISNIQIINCSKGLLVNSATECVFDTIRFQKCSVGLENNGSDVVFKNLFGRFCNVGMDLKSNTNVETSHFWVRDDQPEFVNSVYAKVHAGAVLENVQIDNYQYGVETLDTGSYPTLISGMWQEANTDKSYYLLKLSDASYDAVGGGVRIYNFRHVGKTTSPVPYFSDINSDLFEGYIDYSSCRFVRVQNFPLTTHKAITDISTKIDMVQNRINFVGNQVIGNLRFKVTTAFAKETIGKIPTNLSGYIPIYGKSYIGVIGDQYNMDTNKGVVYCFVSRNRNIIVYSSDGVTNIPANSYVTIDFNYVAESSAYLTE